MLSESGRPRQITTVIQLAAVSYAFGLFSLIASWDFYSALQPVSYTIANQIASLALLVFIYYKIYCGRNWARIVLLVVSLLGMLMMFSRMFQNITLASPPVARLSMLVGLATNLAILWLLFISPGRHWFKRAVAGNVA